MFMVLMFLLFSDSPLMSLVDTTMVLNCFLTLSSSLSSLIDVYFYFQLYKNTVMVNDR